MKLLYSEAGGFHNFPDGENPAGWVDGEPIRQAILDAKRMTDTIPAAPEAPAAPQPPQDTPKRRPGRPPKTSVVENDLGNFPNPD